MSKRSCCCDAGNWLAIPCRFYALASITGRDYYYGPGGFGSPQGAPERVKLYYIFRSEGESTGELIGPFKYSSGTPVFDSTRDVRFMMRGAGGGAAGPYIGGTEEQKYAKGGNGAYTEYQTKANPNHAGIGGAGGSGCTLNIDRYWINPFLGNNFKSGGPSLFIDGDGGDASWIGIGEGGFYDDADYKAAAGGGGGAAMISGAVIYPAQVLGPRNGGNAGISLGENGQDGYRRSFINPTAFDPTRITGKGFGATDMAGGSAGATTPSAGFVANDGTFEYGGNARMVRDEVNGQEVLSGEGGGGGGGWYGGGGGAHKGSGGGGSSKGETAYSFTSTTDYPANYCNPYMNPFTGVGGKKGPRNNTEHGQDGNLVAYYIYGECKCDPSKNTISTPLFICLSQAQVTQILDELATQPKPEGGFWTTCERLFTIDGEEYILLGTCDKQCESVYDYSNKTIENIKWGCSSVDPNDPDADNGPPCCKQIICRPFCPINGADCATCGCPGGATAYVCCNNPSGITLPYYYSVHNGWIYYCTNNHSGWNVPGLQSANLETLCLSPVEGVTCDNTPPDCSQSLAEPFTDCILGQPCNCPDVNATVTLNTNYTQPCGGELGCQEFSGSFTETFEDILCYSGQEFKIQYAEECFPTVLPAQARFDVPQLSFIKVRETEELVLTITFDCIPPQDPNGNYPYSIPSGGNGIWAICGAEVDVDPNTGAYLNSIVSKLNSLLSGRVTLSAITNIHTTAYPDYLYSRIENDITDDRLIVKVYMMHSYFIGCGNVFANVSGAPCNPPFPCGGGGQKSFETGELDGWAAPNINVSGCSCITLTPPDPETAFPGTQIIPCCGDPGTETFGACCNGQITITIS